MSIKHPALSGVTDNPAYGVSKTKHEAAHLAPVYNIDLITTANAAVTPAAASAGANIELYATGKSTRRRIDFSQVDEVRLTSLVITNGNATGASWKLSYMTTMDSTWAGTNSGATIVLGTGTAGALRAGSWVAIPAGMKADVALAVLVDVAMGSTAPTIGSLSLQYR